MRKITARDVGQLTSKSRRSKSPLVFELIDLKVDELLFITKKEWEDFGYVKTSSPSGSIVSTVKSKSGPLHGKRFKTNTYNEGWVITRIV